MAIQKGLETVPFVHLHTHSDYSFLDGAAKVDALLKQAKQLGMPALALTDHGYMHGVIDFYRTALEVGVKPIIGCEVYFTTDPLDRREGRQNLYHLLLLARNMEGYRNLVKLCSLAATEGFYYVPRINLELLQQFSGGLIGASGCMSGVISKSLEQSNPEKARKWAGIYAKTFDPGSFYLEIQDHGIMTHENITQHQLCREIVGLSNELGLPVVGTNDIHYLTREDAHIQDMMLTILSGKTLDDPDRFRLSVEEFYVKPPQEMSAVLRDFPEAISNTVEIAERCNVELEFDRLVLPVFAVPANTDIDRYLRQESIDGLSNRYAGSTPKQAIERLEAELSVVIEKGLSAYFLIVADIVRWAKSQGIGVGPGRGSAAGSIIAYALSITDINPVDHGLLFERFLNPERMEMPDIDMDFDDLRRDEVIAYVRDKYGDDHVAQIVTFSTLKARSSIKDTCRILGYPMGVGARIAQKFISNDPKSTITKSLSSNPDYSYAYQDDLSVKHITDEALRIEGYMRGGGVHPAGVVITPGSVSDLIPIKRASEAGGLVTQYDGPTVARLGLLKMDLLGLRNLTIIQRTLKSIRANYGVDLKDAELPLEDEMALDLLSRGDTAGVFQVESAGMRSLLMRMRPTSFSDVAAVIALHRPGPLASGMDKDFIGRKHGQTDIWYYDQRLKPILEETYGALVYQEQVMLISMTMSGFSAAKADRLRKAMSKKLRHELDQLKPDWIEGAVKNGYDSTLAEELWAVIEPFAEYAFNKSHSVSYAVTVMKTAYLKAHYPEDYFAAVLSSSTGKTDVVAKYIGECRVAGIPILLPDINDSDADFSAKKSVGIRFGLSGIRGLGNKAIEHILASREQGGNFSSLDDFFERVDPRVINSNTVELLIKSGALDLTGYSRRCLYQLLTEESLHENALRAHRDREAGQLSIFDINEKRSLFDAPELPYSQCDEWDERVKLDFERECLGAYVSGHPLRRIEKLLNRSARIEIGRIDGLKDGSQGWFTGMLSLVEIRPTKEGNKLFATMKLEDLTGTIECMAFHKIVEKYRAAFFNDSIVRLYAKYENADRGPKLIVYRVEAFDGKRFVYLPRQLIVSLSKAQITGTSIAHELRTLVRAYPGKDDIVLVIYDQNGEITQKAVMGEKVNASNNTLMKELAYLLGESNFLVESTLNAPLMNHCNL